MHDDAIEIMMRLQASKHSLRRSLIMGIVKWSLYLEDTPISDFFRAAVLQIFGWSASECGSDMIDHYTADKALHQKADTPILIRAVAAFYDELLPIILGKPMHTSHVIRYRKWMRSITPNAIKTRRLLLAKVSEDVRKIRIRAARKNSNTKSNIFSIGNSLAQIKILQYRDDDTKRYSGISFTELTIMVAQVAAPSEPKAHQNIGKLMALDEIRKIQVSLTAINLESASKTACVYAVLPVDGEAKIRALFDLAIPLRAFCREWLIQLIFPISSLPERGLKICSASDVAATIVSEANYEEWKIWQIISTIPIMQAKFSLSSALLTFPDHSYLKTNFLDNETIRSLMNHAMRIRDSVQGDLIQSIIYPANIGNE